MNLTGSDKLNITTEALNAFFNFVPHQGEVCDVVVLDGPLGKEAILRTNFESECDEWAHGEKCPLITHVITDQRGSKSGYFGFANDLFYHHCADGYLMADQVLRAYQLGNIEMDDDEITGLFYLEDGMDTTLVHDEGDVMVVYDLRHEHKVIEASIEDYLGEDFPDEEWESFVDSMDALEAAQDSGNHQAIEMLHQMRNKVANGEYRQASF